MNVHKSVTSERILEAASRQMAGTDNPGICVKCGDECDGCEPDAERYRCEACGSYSVYGAELLLMITHL